MTDTERHCAALLRKADLARYYASLYAPTQARAHVQALYALDVETLNLRGRVSEPLPGEVRLQWWRDAIEGLYSGNMSGHPVVDQLRGAIEAGKLPKAAFERLLDARIFHLYDDPLPDFSDLEGHLGASFSAVVQMACLVLSGGENTGSAEAAGHAGMTSGICWILRHLAGNAASGQSFLPADLLARHGLDVAAALSGEDSARMREAALELAGRGEAHFGAAKLASRQLPPLLRPAFAHLAVAKRDLKFLLAEGRNPFAPLPIQKPLLQFVRVHRAARKGL